MRTKDSLLPMRADVSATSVVASNCADIRSWLRLSVGSALHYAAGLQASGSGGKKCLFAGEGLDPASLQQVQAAEACHRSRRVLERFV